MGGVQPPGEVLHELQEICRSAVNLYWHVCWFSTAFSKLRCCAVRTMCGAVGATQHQGCTPHDLFCFGSARMRASGSKLATPASCITLIACPSINHINFGWHPVIEWRVIYC